MSATASADSLTNAIAIRYQEASPGVVSAAHLALMTNRFDPVDRNFVNPEREFVDDSAKIKKYIGVSRHRHMMSKGKLTWKGYASTESLAMFLGFLYGNVTSSSASSAVNEIQKMTRTGVTAGAFKMRNPLNGLYTAIMAWDVAAATMQTELEAIVGAGNVTVGLATPVYTITFGGSLAATNFPLLELIETTPPTGGSFVMTQDTRGQAAGVRDHEIRTRDRCVLNPPTFPWAEALECLDSTGTFKLYKGCCVNKVTIEIADSGFINVTVEMLTDGRETPIPSFTFPTDETPVTELLGNMVQVYFGSAITSPYLLADDELAGLTITVDAGMTEPARINNKKYVTERRYGPNKPDILISGSLKGDKSSRFWEMLATAESDTREKIQIEIDPQSTPQRKLTLRCSQVLVTGTPVTDGPEPRVDFELKPESNATDDGDVLWTLQTSETNYLQTAP